MPLYDDQQEEYDKENKKFRFAAGRLGFGGAQSFNNAKKYLTDKSADPTMRSFAAIYYNAMIQLGLNWNFHFHS